MQRVWPVGRGMAVVLLLLGAAVASGPVHCLPTNPPLFSASLITSIGRQLDPDFSKPSVTLEPWVLARLRSDGLVRFHALIDRAVDAYQPLKIPMGDVLAAFLVQRARLAEWGVIAQIAAQEIHDWSTEGAQVRNSVGVLGRWRPMNNLAFEFIASPYLSINEYTRRRNGTPFSQTGFLEQFLASYQWGPLKAEFLFLTAQDWAGRWRNLFATLQRITWILHNHISVGVSHQLLHSRVDENTGDLIPVGFFDGRKSRIAGFIQWLL